MRYELMLPHELRRAIDGRVPLVLPVGVLEYHSEHLGLGMDTLAVVKCLELLEKEMELVLLPPFWWGAASYVVEPAARNGSVHVEPDHIATAARDIFTSLLRIGFRNIHFIIHHQSENFAVGMPTDLAFKFAARQAIFAFLEKERGEGWWGDAKMAGYYAQQSQGEDPFNWIKGHPLMTAEIIGQYPFDHAGMGETSLMMALCPEAVDLGKFSAEKWYSRSATQASVELGRKGVALILDHLRTALKRTEASK